MPQSAEPSSDKVEHPPTAFPHKAAADFIIAGLLALKLCVSLWNALFTHARTYDRGNHLDRVNHELLHLGKYSYDPPLYYAPARLYKVIAGDSATTERLMLVMRLENVAILAIAYLCWIYVIISRLFKDWRHRTTASVVLLSLPTFQKFVQATHPDNLHFGLASAAFAYWVVLWTKTASHSTELDDKRWLNRLLALAVLIGATGMTRPFAAVSVAVFWAASIALILLRWKRLQRRAWRDMIAVTAVVGVLSTSWFAYRKIEAGVIGAQYNAPYIKKYAPYRKDFDFVGYFASFHFKALLLEPNREVAYLDTTEPTPFKSKYANSFFTIAYSELWGDHWCYFSDCPRSKGGLSGDEKRWPKRILFVLALPFTLLLAVGLLPSIVRTIRASRSDWVGYFPALVMIGQLFLGGALFLWWQTGEGLTPGKNSGVKALYNGHLLAPLVVIPLLTPVRQRWLTGLFYWGLLLSIISIPVALFWPQWP